MKKLEPKLRSRWNTAEASARSSAASVSKATTEGGTQMRPTANPCTRLFRIRIPMVTLRSNVSIPAPETTPHEEAGAHADAGIKPAGEGRRQEAYGHPQPATAHHLTHQRVRKILPTAAGAVV